MERMVELLREKNLFLEKFFAMNEAELTNFEAGCFDNVQSFYMARDKVLDLIACIDGLIDEETQKVTPPVDPEVRAAVDVLLREKDEWVKTILAQDLQVLAYIEKEKTNIIREMQSLKQARKAVGAYHSGEKTRQLDEKA
jgi:hypothetical protein